MESDSNTVLIQSDTGEQEIICDVVCEELRDTNCSQKLLQEDEKPKHDIVSEHPSSVTALPRSEQKTYFVETFRDCPLQSLVYGKHSVIEVSPSERNCKKITEGFEEKIINTESKLPDGLLSEETEITKSSVSEKTETATIFQSPASEEMDSTEVIQPTFPVETGSTEVIQTAISVETGSPKVTQLPILKETVQTKAIRPTIPPHIPQSSNFEETFESFQNITNHWETSNKSKVPSSSGTRNKITSDIANQPTVQEMCTGSFPVHAIKSQNSKKFLDPSRVASKETNSLHKITSPSQDSESLKSETSITVSGSDCDFQDSANPSPQRKVHNNRFRMPRVSVPINASSKSQSTSVPKDISSDTTLSALLSILVDWINRGLDKVFNRPENSNIADFLHSSEKEFGYGLDVLKHMAKRIRFLLKVAARVPGPPSTLIEVDGQNIFLVRQDLNDIGRKLLSRIEALETEINEDYDCFITACRHFSILNYEKGSVLSQDDEFAINQLRATALRIISNSYVRVSEENLTLNLEIEDFRNRIRNFCSELEKFL